MVSSVSGSGYNDSKKVNIFYFSDYHGNIPAYRHLKTASDEFDKNHKNTENFKLSGGDLTADADPKKRILVYRLIKNMNIDASAVGNHEPDHARGFNFFKEFDKLFNKAPNLLFNNYVTCNVETPDNEKYKQEGLFQSRIITKNNEKYGIIGATTNDDQFDGFKMHDLEQTKKDITTEVENLKKKDPSLNKFILLSHLGVNVDKKIAQSVSDIDIIVGGHSHTLIKGVESGKNLFMTPKNEPVLIVQAGNERGYGELSVEFDKEGRLDLSKGHEPINTTKFIYDYKENLDVKENEDKILDPSVSLGELVKTIRPNNPLIEEHPLANLNADAVKKSTKSDVAILNAGSFRSFINAGPISARHIEYCMPFSNYVVAIKCTGKDLAGIIKIGVDSTSKENVNPGLYQVSGLKYTITPDKKVKNLYTVDEQGNKKIELVDAQGNLTSEGANKEFKVALTDFMVVEIAKKGILTNFVKPDKNKNIVDESKVIKTKDIRQREVLIDYLKNDFAAKNRPIDIETGRITFEKSEKPADNSFLSLVNRFTQRN